MGIEPTKRRANRRLNGFEGLKPTPLAASKSAISVGCCTSVVSLPSEAIYAVFGSDLPVAVKVYLLWLIESVSDKECL